MRTLPCLALLLGSIGLVACSSSSGIDPKSDYVLEVGMSGGLIGVQEKTTIDTAAKTISFRADPKAQLQQDTLSDAEIAGLATKLNEANLPDAEGPYHCEQCSDEMTFDANLKIDGTSYEVIWDGDQSSPAELNSLGSEIDALVQAHFPHAP